MIKVIINGAMGHMGAILTNLVSNDKDMELVASVDKMSHGGAVLSSFDDYSGKADIVIDFSHHTAVYELLDWCERTGTAVIVATTGHTEDEKARIYAAAEKVPVFYAANMSLGIALLADMAKKTAAMFPDADIEIVESHHNRKVDAPSGTALFLAEAVKEVRPESVFNMGRSGMAKRQENEIGIHSLRMGNLPGTHEVIVTTATQSITLRHEVYDRALFAEGAITAAKYLYGKGAGMYNMQTMLA